MKHHRGSIAWYKEMTKRLDNETDEIRQLKGRLSRKAIKHFGLFLGVLGIFAIAAKIVENAQEALKQYKSPVVR